MSCDLFAMCCMRLPIFFAHSNVSPDLKGHLIFYTTPLANFWKASSNGSTAAKGGRRYCESGDSDTARDAELRGWTVMDFHADMMDDLSNFAVMASRAASDEAKAKRRENHACLRGGE